MTVSTVAVTCRASLQNGEPVPGAVFTFKLDRTDLDLTADSVVAPYETKITADEDGLAVWETWPNTGTQGSVYRVRATNPATGRRFLDRLALIPNEDCNLEDCILEDGSESSSSGGSSVTFPIAISQGGTGATSLAAAQTALEIDLKVNTSAKDATGGVPSLTAFSLSLMNILGTFKSLLTNANTAARTYLLQDRNGTLADNTDIAALQTNIDAKANKALTISSKSANYTLVVGDAGGVIYHPSADTTARTFTIPANASVAFEVGTTITFDNDYGAGAISISITTDTLVLVGAAGTTGTRTLASGGQATAVKVSATRWRINGTGLS